MLSQNLYSSLKTINEENTPTLQSLGPSWLKVPTGLIPKILEIFYNAYLEFELSGINYLIKIFSSDNELIEEFYIKDWESKDVIDKYQKEKVIYEGPYPISMELPVINIKISKTYVEFVFN